MFNYQDSMMKTQIVNFSVRQSSNFVACLYFVVSLPIVLIVAAYALVKGQGLEVALVSLAVPLVYAVIAYIGTALMVIVYNFVAKRVGGIEFTTSDTAER